MSLSPSQQISALQAALDDLLPQAPLYRIGQAALEHGFYIGPANADADDYITPHPRQIGILNSPWDPMLAPGGDAKSFLRQFAGCDALIMKLNLADREVRLVVGRNERRVRPAELHIKLGG